MKPLQIYILIILAAVVALAGCDSPEGAGGANTAPAETLRVGSWKTQQTIQPFLYDQCLPEDLGVEVKPFTNPGDMKTALLAGSLDMAGTTLVHAIVSGARGEPIVLVAGLADKCSALVVSNQSEISKPADLKGKKIGYVPSTMHHILLLNTLERAGLTQDDVTLMRIDFFDMMNAMSHGQIDAFLSGEPFPTMTVDQQIGHVLAYPYYDDSVGSINAGMIVRRDFLEEHPDRVEALVRAHRQATEFYLQNRSEWLHDAAEFGPPIEILALASENIALRWDMDATFVRQVKTLGEEMLRLGMIDRLPDWNALIDTRFVEQLRDEQSTTP